ncbi:MAG TPA: RagB/SusD family nutrient uptake outer membrane protein [Bacteroidetes bacterium]|nr:RagB/SusD family nutrient uptake outer membrane protein [Bacteroidota bacterium]
MIRTNILIKFSFLTMLVFASCKEDFLETEPLGKLSTDIFFQTEDHAVWATNAVYNSLREWDVHVFHYIGMTDIVSDDADKGSIPDDAAFLNDLDNFSLDAGHVSPESVWRGYYRAIYRANLAIENIPGIAGMDGALKERLVAECRFLRACFYFNMVRWFGDLPLIDHPLQPDEYEQVRAPKEEVYALIISDLEAAIQGLPEKSGYTAAETGRATRGAAKGMLAKVYLTLADFANAEKYALEVIQSGEYELFPNYTTLFQPAGENSSESLFEVQAAAFETGGGATQYNQVQGVRGSPNLGWGFNRPSDDLVAAYEPGDPRREATILYVGEVLPDGSAIVQDNPDMFNERYNQKAWVPPHPGFQENGPGNIRILRYADVLLIAAEAANENGKPADALLYLNMVRTRARGQNIGILPDITETNKDLLRQIIWHERRVELAMEQQRWFDLVRQGRAAQVMKAVGKDFTEGKHELFPVPQKEIDLGGGRIVQNPGY